MDLRLGKPTTPQVPGWYLLRGHHLVYGYEPELHPGQFCFVRLFVCETTGDRGRGVAGKLRIDASHDLAIDISDAEWFGPIKLGV